MVSPRSATVYFVNGLAELIPVPSFAVTGELGATRLVRVADADMAAYTVRPGAMTTAVDCGGTQYLGLGGKLYTVGAMAAHYGSATPAWTRPRAPRCRRRRSTATRGRSRRPFAVARPDVLLVSLGTTLGWRVADEMLLEQLRRAGASTAAVSVALGAADRLRRGYPLNDLVEMHAARRAVRSAVSVTSRAR